MHSRSAYGWRAHWQPPHPQSPPFMMAMVKASRRWQDVSDDDDDVESEQSVLSNSDSAARSDYDDSDAEEQGAVDPAEGSEQLEEGAGFAQFLDSDEDDDEGDTQSEASGSAASVVEEDDEHSRDEAKRLKGQLAQVPFASLVKARKVLRAQSDEEDQEGGENISGPESPLENGHKDKKAQSARIAREIEKRESKHAPTEMSSRKPVSRRRQVVEGLTSSHERRDPRFSSLSASLPNRGLFNASYGFLREQQSSEIRELRKVLAKLKEKEAHHAGPRASSELALGIRAEREKVERALRREEGRENERSRREREQNVVSQAKKEIEERVKQGGKRYFLKDSDKKKLVLRDKFESLSQVGPASGTEQQGGGAKRGSLQRAVDRRRKKNAARERSIPLGGGATGRASANFYGSQDLGSAPMPKRKRMSQSQQQRDGDIETSRQAPSARSFPRKRGRRG